MNAPRLRVRLFAALLLPFALSACGNRGDLYLPPEEQPAGEQPPKDPERTPADA